MPSLAVTEADDEVLPLLPLPDQLEVEGLGDALPQIEPLVEDVVFNAGLTQLYGESWRGEQGRGSQEQGLVTGQAHLNWNGDDDDLDIDISNDSFKRDDNDIDQVEDNDDDLEDSMVRISCEGVETSDQPPIATVLTIQSTLMFCSLKMTMMTMMIIMITMMLIT